MCVFFVERGTNDVMEGIGGGEKERKREKEKKREREKEKRKKNREKKKRDSQHVRDWKQKRRRIEI